ncbi:MAG: cell division ATP-binding protein FtsE [Mycoplasmatales bacterium]
MATKDIEKSLEKTVRTKKKLTSDKDKDVIRESDSKGPSTTTNLRRTKIIDKELDNQINFDDFDYLKDDKTTSLEKEEVKEDKIEEQHLEEENFETIKLETDEEEIKNEPGENTILLNSVEKSDYKFDTNQPVTISFKDVKLKIDKEQILKGISLDIHQGEFVYFVGSSGAGKSSMIKLIYKEVKPSSGKLEVLNMNVGKLSFKKLPQLRRRIGVVFQDFKLLKDKTIYENVKFSLDVTGYPKDQKEEKVLKTLKLVGIHTKKDKYPDELSGGQQQRAAIARAIVDDPEILVCDEPTGNLDPENAIAIMEILKKLNNSGKTILMATHDVGIVNKYKSRVVLMRNGKIANEVNGEYIYE